jgi:hypothetical protein
MTHPFSYVKKSIFVDLRVRARKKIRSHKKTQAKHNLRSTKTPSAEKFSFSNSHTPKTLHVRRLGSHLHHGRCPAIDGPHDNTKAVQKEKKRFCVSTFVSCTHANHVCKLTQRMTQRPYTLTLALPRLLCPPNSNLCDGIAERRRDNPKHKSSQPETASRSRTRTSLPCSGETRWSSNQSNRLRSSRAPPMLRSKPVAPVFAGAAPSSWRDPGHRRLY